MLTRKLQLLLLGLIMGMAGSVLRADNSLNCTLQDESGKPAEKLEVVLTNTGTNKQWKKKTSDKGTVEFKGLPDGTYRLEGAIQGFLLTKADGIQLSGNTSQTCSPVFVSVEKLNQLLNDSMQAARAGKPDDAIAKAKEAVAMAPTVAQTHNMLAVAYATKGMKDEAMASSKKAVEIDKQFEKMMVPIQMQAIGTQASNALTKQDFDTAIAKYKEIEALNPAEPSVYYNMALAYGHKGDFDNAMKSIDKAIELKPDDMEFRQRKTQLQDMYLKSTEKSLTK